MTKQYAAKSFKSGNSVAIRMPAALGIKPDREWVVSRADDGKLTIEERVEAPKKIDLTGIWGSCPGLKPIPRENRIMEPRDLDWGGKLLRRD